jgi:hypothetical protein
LLQGARDTARQDPGLDIDHVVDVRVAPSLARRVAARLSSHPEVEEVAFTPRPPLFGPLNTTEVGVAGQRLRAGHNFVSRGYFRVLGIPLLAGRTFSQDEEDGTPPVAVVSAATARRFWPAGEPLGQTIRVAASLGDEVTIEHDVVVIGVVGDVMSGLVVDGLDHTVVYLPMNLSDEREQALLVRTRSAASAALSAIDAAVGSEAGANARQLAPMRDVLRFQSWPLLLFGSAMSALAAFGVVLALAGCYGMLAYTVARRTRELGIRAAVGATSGALAWFIAGQSAFIASIAIPAGIVLALGLSRIMTSTLVMAPSFGMSSFIIGAIAGLATTAAASYLPTRRATRVDPAEALRAE